MNQFEIKQAVWNKTQGHCYYCGIKIDYPEPGAECTINYATDHFIPPPKKPNYNTYEESEIQNYVPSCRVCNSTKGNKTISEFRKTLQRGRFKDFYGVLFSQAQETFLEVELNVRLPYEEIVFWFERQRSGGPSS